jgi:hypothetical protein
MDQHLAARLAHGPPHKELCSFEELTSHGYGVVSVAYPGGSTGVLYPNGYTGVYGTDCQVAVTATSAYASEEIKNPSMTVRCQSHKERLR